MKNKSTGSFESVFAMIIFAIIAMPIFGIYLCTQPDRKEEEKAVGAFMIVLGFAIWLLAGIIG